ncbi:hypothetical protein LguiA_007254 [Lonicera macranthoides]
MAVDGGSNLLKKKWKMWLLQGGGAGYPGTSLSYIFGNESGAIFTICGGGLEVGNLGNKLVMSVLYYEELVNECNTDNEVTIRAGTGVEDGGSYVQGYKGEREGVVVVVGEGNINGGCEINNGLHIGASKGQPLEKGLRLGVSLKESRHSDEMMGKEEWVGLNRTECDKYEKLLEEMEICMISTGGYNKRGDRRRRRREERAYETSDIVAIPSHKTGHNANHPLSNPTASFQPVVTISPQGAGHSFIHVGNYDITIPADNKSSANEVSNVVLVDPITAREINNAIQEVFGTPSTIPPNHNQGSTSSSHTMTSSNPQIHSSSVESRFHNQFDPIANWEDDGEGENWDIFGESDDDIVETEVHNEKHQSFNIPTEIKSMKDNLSKGRYDF